MKHKKISSMYEKAAFSKNQKELPTSQERLEKFHKDAAIMDNLRINNAQMIKETLSEKDDKANEEDLYDKIKEVSKEIGKWIDTDARFANFRQKLHFKQKLWEYRISTPDNINSHKAVKELKKMLCELRAHLGMGENTPNTGYIPTKKLFTKDSLSYISDQDKASQQSPKHSAHEFNHGGYAYYDNSSYSSSPDDSGYSSDGSRTSGRNSDQKIEDCSILEQSRMQFDLKLQEMEDKLKEYDQYRDMDLPDHLKPPQELVKYYREGLRDAWVWFEQGNQGTNELVEGRKKLEDAYQGLSDRCKACRAQVDFKLKWMQVTQAFRKYLNYRDLPDEYIPSRDKIEEFKIRLEGAWQWFKKSDQATNDVLLQANKELNKAYECVLKLCKSADEYLHAKAQALVKVGSSGLYDLGSHDSVNQDQQSQNVVKPLDLSGLPQENYCLRDLSSLSDSSDSGSTTSGVTEDFFRNVILGTINQKWVWDQLSAEEKRHFIYSNDAKTPEKKIEEVISILQQNAKKYLSSDSQISDSEAIEIKKFYDEYKQWAAWERQIPVIIMEGPEMLYDVSEIIARNEKSIKEAIKKTVRAR